MKLTPTPNQEQLISGIINNDVCICSGFAGTGKSFWTLLTAVGQLKQKHVSNILICRSLVSVGKDIGSLPGDVKEKSDPYFIFVTEYLKEMLSREYDKYIKEETVKTYPVELLRGHTYHNTFMILDEAQNCDPAQIKMFLSRMGKNSRAVVIGDVTQKDTNKENGLKFCVDHFGDNKTQGCCVVKLGYEDIKRNTKIQHILRVFDENER